MIVQRLYEKWKIISSIAFKDFDECGAMTSDWKENGDNNRKE